MARTRARRKDQQDWTHIEPNMPDVCPLCADTPTFPNDMLTHLQRHAPAALCQRCEAKDKGWRLDGYGATHFGPDIGIFYCSNCGRYAPLEVAPQDGDPSRAAQPWQTQAAQLFETTPAEQRGSARQYKEKKSMTQPDAIDTLLAELRQELSNTPTMLNIALALRRNSAHLLQLVHTMLAELGDEIARAVPVLPEEPAEGDEQDITGYKKVAYDIRRGLTDGKVSMSCGLAPTRASSPR